LEDQRKRNSIQKKQLPITHNENVEFSMEAADEEDLEALQRADAADQRNKEGK